MEKNKKIIRDWVVDHYLNIGIFNLFMMFLVLMHSAKYFDPFWVISINMIVFLGLVASVFLLGSNSKTMFLASLVFWVFASSMRFFKINVWAERAGVYVFQAFFVGMLLLIFENSKMLTFNKK